ncbi:NAD dependent epimerase/dehydratase family protein [Arachidicoccus rhizosphaerae]|uniref:NAD dependent epimerase/dehydratase family protein n=1 Tax=Arachidicoccus rhizosphaerae TaxID=551991 RepID=A0A1H4CMQ7_9BACT|nr:NAD-dependent epimerase/dehydratase family protein [Arachidicoccus rhizosphaerae]SEA61609.1 NAD dependent epimerase/dehydratase family protein [Arachidicoccus rhizosphaerae]
MVLGNGMIASALKKVDRPDVLFAASGLSNLKGADPVERLRERNLLKEQLAQHPDKIFVYISSYSIDDQSSENNTPYLAHKVQMEELVKGLANRFLICRTSNVVGNSKQPGNLMNFICEHLKTGAFFDIWTNTSRNLIDVSDLAEMAAAAIDMGHVNETLYLIHPSDIAIYDIVRHFETFSAIAGHYRLVEKGVYYRADKTLSKALFDRLGFEKDADLYTRKLIGKYFASRFS